MPETGEQIKFSELCKFQPKQLEATKLADEHQYFLYGGSRGPGKSYWLRWYLLRELLRLAKKGTRNAIVGLFCEDYPALTDRQTSKINKEFPDWLGQVKDSKTSGFGFHLRPEYGSGVLALRNLDDVSKYQSAEFAAIGVDELTKNEEKIFDILRGSLRWAGVEKPRFVAATNPGSAGHVWVKKLWVDREFPERLAKLKNEFCFLPALPTDNRYLDPSYWEMLESLEDRLKRAWRYGDWNAFEGQFFRFDESSQLIEPFEIPSEWTLIAGLDPGYSSPCSFSISAMDFEGNLYRIATYYETNQSPQQNAKSIKSFIDGLQFTKGRMPRTIVADPSAWAKKDKYAISNNEMTFADVCREEGIYLIKAINDRIPGWWAMKDMMTRKTTKEIEGETVVLPQYYVFKYYNQPFLNEIASAVGDDNNPEDIQGRGNDPAVPDHAIDEERYKIMSIYKPKVVKVDNRPDWIKNLKKENNKISVEDNFMAV